MKVEECKQMEMIMQQGLVTNFVNSKTMTDIGDTIYMDNNDINNINYLKELVDNGKLNQDQAKKIIMKRIYLFQTKWAIAYFENLFN
jgi:polyhydroxyalkanoate synthesis regulator phasin